MNTALSRCGRSEAGGDLRVGRPLGERSECGRSGERTDWYGYIADISARKRQEMEIETLAPIAHDSVRVGPGTPMAAIAHAAGVPTSRILDLNPQVLRGITPPKTGNRTCKSCTSRMTSARSRRT